jgi:hypothetical protein
MVQSGTRINEMFPYSQFGLPLDEFENKQRTAKVDPCGWPKRDLLILALILGWVILILECY